MDINTPEGRAEIADQMRKGADAIHAVFKGREQNIALLSIAVALSEVFQGEEAINKVMDHLRDLVLDLDKLP